MTITELLQSDDYPTRINVGWRWLIGDNGFWKVYERRPYAKTTRIVCITKDEAEAVARLIED